MRLCGALTRKRKPCRKSGNGKGGRCLHHGGQSTGPLTGKGRRHITAAQAKRWTEWRAANPRLFVEIGVRQERRAKALWRRYAAGENGLCRVDGILTPERALKLARVSQRKAENEHGQDLIRRHGKSRPRSYVGDRQSRVRVRLHGGAPV